MKHVDKLHWKEKREFKEYKEFDKLSKEQDKAQYKELEKIQKDKDLKDAETSVVDPAAAFKPTDKHFDKRVQKERKELESSTRKSKKFRRTRTVTSSLGRKTSTSSRWRRTSTSRP